MKPAVLRVAWAVVVALVAVDAGVLLAWDSLHPSRPPAASTAAAPTVTTPGVTGDGGAAPAETASAAPAAAAPTASASARSSKSASASVPATAAPGAAKAATIDRGDLLFDLTVDPACTTRLKQMAATVRAVPGAYVSMVVAYSDGESYGTMYAGPMLPDGTFVLRWTVPADAATGTGHVLAAAHDPAQKTSGRNVAEFVVKGGAGC